jgi:hypothetical protein
MSCKLATWAAFCKTRNISIVIGAQRAILCYAPSREKEQAR